MHGTRLLVNSETDQIVLLNLLTSDRWKHEELEDPMVYTGAVNSSYLRNATFNADESCIISGDEHGRIFYWSTRSGEVIKILEAPSQVLAHPLRLEATRSVVRVLPTNNVQIPGLLVSNDTSLFVWNEKHRYCDESEVRVLDCETVLNDQDFLRSSAVEMEEEEEEEEVEEELQAWEQDGIELQPGECSYGAYGYIRQVVYTCTTCTNDLGLEAGGICAQCVEWCHRDHEVKNIGIKRSFRCGQ